MVLCFGQAFSAVFDKYEGNGLDEVRLHYTITNSLLGAMAGATLLGSNAALIADTDAMRISLGLGGAILGATLGGYLGYPKDAKLGKGFEEVFFTLADGFLGAVIIGTSTGVLANTIIPQTGDVPVAGIIGMVLGGVGGGLLGGVYGYRFAVHF